MIEVDVFNHLILNGENAFVSQTNRGCTLQIISQFELAFAPLIDLKNSFIPYFYMFYFSLLVAFQCIAVRTAWTISGYASVELLSMFTEHIDDCILDIRVVCPG